MKKIRLTALALAAMICLAGCKDNTTPSETTPPTEPPVTVAPTQSTENPNLPTVYENMYSISLPITVDKQLDGDTLLYTYSYQSIYPILQDREVSDKIVMDFTDRTEKTKANALNEANLDHTAEGFTPISFEVLYDVTRVDQGVLSLFGHSLQVSQSTGSDRSLIAANYDLVTGDVLTLGSILYHIDTKDDLAQLVIDHLDSRDDIVLFDEYRDTVTARFQLDESVDEDFYFSDSGLCFYFAPYEIAPRSSGTIIVEIPYNELTGIIADAYFPAERTYSNGSITVSAFNESNWEGYEQFVEVINEADATKVLLTTDSAVQDIRIYHLISTPENPSYMEAKNIYATNFLSSDNAIVLEAEFNATNPNYQISYSVNGETQSFYFTVDSSAGAISLSAIS